MLFFPVVFVVSVISRNARSIIFVFNRKTVVFQIFYEFVCVKYDVSV